MAEFEKLSQVLFGGKSIATDFKTMPGTEARFTRDELAASLLESMERVGLIEDGQLVNPQLAWQKK